MTEPYRHRATNVVAYLLLLATTACGQQAQPAGPAHDPAGRSPAFDAQTSCADSCLLLVDEAFMAVASGGYCDACTSFDPEACSSDWPSSDQTGCDQLDEMRACIYAAHGAPLDDETWRKVFAAKPWYRPDPAFAAERMSKVAQDNVAYLGRRVGAKDCFATEVPGVIGGQIGPDERPSPCRVELVHTYRDVEISDETWKTVRLPVTRLVRDFAAARSGIDWTKAPIAPAPLTKDQAGGSPRRVTQGKDGSLVVDIGEGDGELSYTFDAMGRTSKVSFDPTADAGTYEFTYRYDCRGDEARPLTWE